MRVWGAAALAVTDMPPEAHVERVELAVDGLADDLLAGVAPRGLVGDAAAQLSGALDAPLVDPERLGVGLWRTAGDSGIRFLDVEESLGHGRAEEAHHRVEEIGIEGAAVVGQKQALDAVPASARLGRENPVSPHMKYRSVVTRLGAKS